MGLASGGFAETLRLTSWNLGSSSTAGSPNRTNDAKATALAIRTASPDVVLLQGVSGWQECFQLAEMFKPEDFKVVICSSFPELTGEKTPVQQVAILSRHKAYFSWAEQWKNDSSPHPAGGFAFAAIQIGNSRVGFFTAIFDDGVPPEGSVHELLAQREVVRRWEMNQVRAFVTAGTFERENPLTSKAAGAIPNLLENAGFVDALELLPAAQRAARSSSSLLFIEPAVFPSPRLELLSGKSPSAATCDLEIDPAKASIAWTSRARQAEQISRSQAANLDSSAFRQLPLRLRWAAAGAIVFVFGMAAFARSRNRKVAPQAPLLIADHSQERLSLGSAVTVVLAGRSATGSASDSHGSPSQPIIHIESPSNTQTQTVYWQERALKAEQKAEGIQEVIKQGMLPHLRRWLKQKLARKLIADRAELLQTQQDATRKLVNVDERLSRIEQQIQQQNRAYEQRIEELTCELVAAKEENRELIRHRIAQVKAEMEAARARALAQAGQPES